MTDKQKDQRLRRVYGITLDDYRWMLLKKRGGCWICGKIPEVGKKSLAVDHDHKARYAKITTKKMTLGWLASTTYNGRVVDHIHSKKNLAIRAVREKLKTASVRGLLCWADNVLLQKARDRAEILESAAKYLREFERKI